MDEKIELIKKEALDEHIPILMDETLDVIVKYLKKIRPKKMLEIGTATRIFFNLFYEKFRRRF